MMTTPPSAGADGRGQYPSPWSIPTILEFDTVAADGLAEQWLTVVDRAEAPRVHADVQPSPAREVAPVPQDVTQQGVTHPGVTRQEVPRLEVSSQELTAQGVTAQEAATQAVVFAGSAETPVPARENTALMELADATPAWPAGRSIETYVHRLEAAQLALLIARADAEHVQARRRRARQQLRRAVSAFAVGAVASALFVALAMRVDSPSMAATAAPPAAVERAVTSPIGLSVRFARDAGSEAPARTVVRPAPAKPRPTAAGTRRKGRKP